MEILLKIGTLVLSAYSVLVLYRVVFDIVGFVRGPKVFPEARVRHTYGVIIAARNEERVIGNLIRSIRRQDYDPEKLRIFVVADNCTDRTAEICRELGAVVYERHDEARMRKGYALEFLFRQIQRDYGVSSLDAYLFFDADNLLARNFVTEINKAFDACGEIAVGYRNTKNFDTNFISAGYGFHFYNSTMTMHRPRSLFGQSTHIAGTGYAVSSALLSGGWHYTCLTEDTQFCLTAVAQGRKIEFCEAAEFFDEQPHTVRVMVRQRLRWAKGRLACFFLLFPRLIRGIFRCKERKFSCYDMFFYILPKALLSALASVLYTAVSFLAALWTSGVSGGAAPGGVRQALSGLFLALGVSWLRLFLLGALIAVRERRHIRCKTGRLVLYTLLWPYFDLIGLPISIASLFMRVKWKPIRHDQGIAIEEIEGAEGRERPPRPWG